MTEGPVSSVFDTAGNVAIMKLRSVVMRADGEVGYGYGGIKHAILTVEKVYKGKLKPGQELKFAQGAGGDCIWTFSEELIGTEFLFFLGADRGKSLARQAVDDGLWRAYICSRSSSVRSAAADLLYIDNLPKVRGRNRISGRLSKEVKSPIEEERGSVEFLPKRRVQISGNGKTINLTTDANGVYEIYDLSPGKYKITPERIPGFKVDGEPQDSSSVELGSDDQEEEDFEFVVDNRIKGRFFDASGKALAGVCLDLVPIRGTPAKHGVYLEDCTDSAGRFEIDDIPPATYVLVINEGDRITATQPFGKFYYPSAKRREDAAEFTIGPGDFREDLIVNAPETKDVITVSGVLLLEDGKPATNKNTEHVSIEFYLDDKNASVKKGDDPTPESRSEIDETGRFTMRILKGQSGILVATMNTYEGKYENCPKMDKLIELGPDRFTLTNIRSTEMRIYGVADVVDVQLKFPFPSCRLKKIE